MGKLPVLLRVSCILLISVVAVLILIYARGFLIPMAWSILFALMLLPMTRWLQKLVKYNVLACSISLIVLLGAIGGTLYLLSSQVYALSDELPAIGKKLDTYLGTVEEIVEDDLNVDVNLVEGDLQDRITGLIEGRMGTVSKLLGQTLSATVSTLTILGLIPIFTFFLLFYRTRIRHFIRLLYKRSNKGTEMQATAAKASHVVQEYCVGLLIVTIVVAVLSLIVFLVLGIRHAIFFAIFVAILNLVPYLGVFVGIALSGLYVWLTTDSLWYPIIFLASMQVIQLLENNVIRPLIVGKQIQLNALAVIIVVIIGGMIWSVSGMILFIPLLGAIKVFMDNYPETRAYGYLLGDEPLEEV